MKAKVVFQIEIEANIEIDKDIKDVSILELDLKGSNLGNCLIDTVRHLDTNKLLNSKINNDYKVLGLSVSKFKRKIELE